MFNEQEYRIVFPEFSDYAKYPVARVTYFAGLADKSLNRDTLGDLYDHCRYLFVSHHLAPSASNVASASMPGDDANPVASKSVGDVSVSYDTASTTEAEAGLWNRTSYGRELIRLMRNAGGVVRYIA